MYIYLYIYIFLYIPGTLNEQTFLYLLCLQLKMTLFERSFLKRTDFSKSSTFANEPISEEVGNEITTSEVCFFTFYRCIPLAHLQI